MENDFDFKSINFNNMSIRSESEDTSKISSSNNLNEEN